MDSHQPKTRAVFSPHGLPGGTVILAACFFAVQTLATMGCSDDHRRLSEGEALDYKRELLKRNELSASQVTRFGSDSRRTRAEIDALYQELSADSAEQRAKERAYWESDLRRQIETEGVEP